MNFPESKRLHLHSNLMKEPRLSEVCPPRISLAIGFCCACTWIFQLLFAMHASVANFGLFCILECHWSSDFTMQFVRQDHFAFRPIWGGWQLHWGRFLVSGSNGPDAMRRHESFILLEVHLHCCARHNQWNKSSQAPMILPEPRAAGEVVILCKLW